ncbi:uncharacterized protein LOC110881945 [Helianthus annuus]|uniref:uncharacterized protein LOC110881945 n=1 Tax=Helianthus annuus TaxID=4232 RepID=UPI000B8FB9B6|nr:uncharacterized protein LOC110881945 [Helianthus annuus]
MERVDVSNKDDRKKPDVVQPDVRLKAGGSFQGLSFMPRRGTISLTQLQAAASDPFPLHTEGPRMINIIDELTKVTSSVPLEKESTVGQNDTTNGQGSVKKPSFVSVLKTDVQEKVKFRFLETENVIDDVDVTIPLESVKKVQSRFENVIYGYFLGKRLAFPVVEYFAKNKWQLYGLEKCMMNSKGFFFFKFSDKAGMEQVLTEGPWLIRNVPIFLRAWTTDVELKKDELKHVPVWVKIHDIPLAAYTDDGLSLLASRIGKPMFLDKYTSNMCLESWGKSSFARAVIEIDANQDMKDSLKVAIPNLEGEGVSKATIGVEYEWKPPRCHHCCVFGHEGESCPKHVNLSKEPKLKQKVDDDGFMDANKKKSSGNQKPGIMLNKPKKKFEYRAIQKPSQKQDKPNPHKASTSAPVVNISNSFASLDELPNEDDLLNSDVDEVLENNEGVAKVMTGDDQQTGASTPDIVESHIHVSNLNKICSSIRSTWNWTSNGSLCSKGTRIILGWDSNIVDIMTLAQSDQVMHTQVHFKNSKKIMFCSFVYAKNSYIERRELWDSLKIHKAFAHDKPWVILGDFNAALYLEDKSMGSSLIDINMREFKSCVEDIEVVDVNRSGCHFTWNQKPKQGIGVLKKIDRIMANVPFIQMFPEAVAVFQPYRVSDHCPCILKNPRSVSHKPKPFKFPNFLVFKKDFPVIVKKTWEQQFLGIKMLQVVKKLRVLKKPLRSLLAKQGNIHEKVKGLRKELDEIQLRIDANPSDSELRSLESKCLKEFQDAALDEERFLKQKSKVKWLEVGDSNSAFFHNTVKCKNHFSRIDVIKDANGITFEGSDVGKALVTHYESFFGQRGIINCLPTSDLFRHKIDENIAHHMVRAFSNEDIKAAMFSIGSLKAPGPDGYSSDFFKHTWHIIGDDICGAVQEFFQSGKILKEINHTFLALIPKVPTPDTVSDFRPIACCNVIYKCISKLITTRILEGLNGVVSLNQSAFIPGRCISDNILLTQELLHNYHRDYGPPRCAFKVDIQKAYDTVDWVFLEAILKGFGFHPTMVEWIMVCVSSTSFSICVNGNVYGYFKGRRGLRQGDPMSPYLFTLVMEILTSILHNASTIDSSFRFHNRCVKQRIINLCFADDLLLFARGEVASVKTIMSSLNRFKDMSGLHPSLAKSTIFMCNIDRRTKRRILRIVPFQQGEFPIRYLGVPLITTKLSYKDCRVLSDRLESRITNWKNKTLSFAGRLQLILSVLSAMSTYWASVFTLPARTIKELEQKMRGFLWCQGPLMKGKAKVSWNSVCMPKAEGGLGIRRLNDMNISLMTKHINSILSGRQSLWVDWVKIHLLKDRNFWDIPIPSICSWGWRNLLKGRVHVQRFFWTKIGDGMATSAWYDSWCELCPLGNLISPSMMRQAGLSIHSKVADLISEGNWNWPSHWLTSYPVLNQLPSINLSEGVRDVVLWKDINERLVPFSSSDAWECIRSRGTQVSWYNLVWFSQCIPRHAFVLWLVFRRKLVTQDRIRQWNIDNKDCMNLMCCLLCHNNIDSHHHLFFECKYATEVWNCVNENSAMKAVGSNWDEIVSWLLPRARSRSIATIIGKLLVAATTYFIWRERNSRFFNNQLRPPEKLADHIISNVRLKLKSLKFKDTIHVRQVLQEWEISFEDT